MERKIQKNRFIQAVILFAALFLLPIQTANAVDKDFYEGNDILFYDPSATNACVDPGASAGIGNSTTGNGANNNLDYKGRQIISDEHLEKIKINQPIYEKAAAEAKVPWQAIAVIHIRESVLADFNPDNGQGVYQDVARLGNGGKDYPPGPVTDEEFLRQTVWAANFLRDKAGSKADLVEKGDPDAIKEMFFNYNGSATAYTQQAAQLGFTNGFEGSPYVMNIADEKRDPEVNKTTWGQIKRDYGPIEYPANGDYGAFVMYAALAGIPASSGSCTGSGLNSRAGANGWAVSGQNAMKLYYQIEEPWASAKYGPYTIRDWGCGPTSTAMAIANLNNDSSVNPENMAQLFYENNFLVESGTSWAAWAPDTNVTRKYGVTMTELGTDLSKAADALKRGSFVILSVRGEPFTCASCGHILLFRGVTDSGNFLVANPANKEQTMNEEGFSVKAAGDYGIRNMWEVRKG